MVVSGINKDSVSVIVNCDCGCDEEIHIKKIIFEGLQEDEDYYLSILAGKFSERQKGIFKLIFHRIKLAWKMLLGKEYLLTEIVMTKSDFNEFKKKLGEL